MDQWKDQLFIWIESVMMMTHIILIGIGFISSTSDFKVGCIFTMVILCEFHFKLSYKNKPSEDVRHMIMVPMVHLVPNQWTQHIIPDHLIVSLRQHRRTNQWTRQ